jgi:hypothetical protein
LLHELPEELRVHAIDAQDDEFMAPLPSISGALAGKQRSDAGQQQSGK